jgi:PAS domain S-box-containing protein
MADKEKTKEELIKEIELLQKEFAEFRKQGVEYKQTQETLQESESKYSDLVENMIDLIYSLDTDGKVISINKAVKAMLGYEPEELIGKNFIERIPKEALPKAMVVFKEIIGGEKITTETILLDKNGRPHNVELSSTPAIRDNRVAGSWGIIRDITARKKAEEALRASENKYKILLENLTQKIFYKDKDSVYVSCNENYARDLKIKADEIAGKIDYDFYPKELAEKYIKDDRMIMQAGKIQEVEEKYIQDEKEIFVHTIKIPVKDDRGNVVGILGIFWDVSEQKKAGEELRDSEERLKILFEYAPDAYYLNDLEGNFVDGNKAAERITGYKREELIGKSFLKLNLLPLNQMPKALAVLAKNVLGQPTGPDEFILNRKDGTQLAVEITTYVVKIKGRTLVLGIARDITERKKREPN